MDSTDELDNLLDLRVGVRTWTGVAPRDLRVILVVVEAGEAGASDGSERVTFFLVFTILMYFKRQ